jgi:hypothetical protein
MVEVEAQEVDTVGLVLQVLLHPVQAVQEIHQVFLHLKEILVVLLVVQEREMLVEAEELHKQVREIQEQIQVILRQVTVHQTQYQVQQLSMLAEEPEVHTLVNKQVEVAKVEADKVLGMQVLEVQLELQIPEAVAVAVQIMTVKLRQNFMVVPAVQVL